VTLEFFKSYLNSRKQMVEVNGKMSMSASVEWGVPQGSVLGPLLFLISVNDLPSSIGTKSVLYADDTTFINTADNITQLNLLAKHTISEAAVWFATNGFLLNETKTQSMICTLNSFDVSNVEDGMVNSSKFLGIFLDNKLKWHQHIDHISSKLSRSIYLLKKLTFCIPFHYLKTTYFAYFQSIFRYGLILFGNCSRINEILLLQKKAIRVITKSDPVAHCKPLFIKLEIQTIINLYIFDLATFILKNKDCLKFSNEIHGYNTRNKTQAVIEHHFHFCPYQFNGVLLTMIW